MTSCFCLSFLWPYLVVPRFFYYSLLPRQFMLWVINYHYNHTKWTYKPSYPNYWLTGLRFFFFFVFSLSSFYPFILPLLLLSFSIHQFIYIIYITIYHKMPPLLWPCHVRSHPLFNEFIITHPIIPTSKYPLPLGNFFQSNDCNHFSLLLFVPSIELIKSLFNSTYNSPTNWT